MSIKIRNTAFIHPTASVSGNVAVGDHSGIWDMSVVRGDESSISIGEHTNIQDMCVIHSTHANPFHPEGSKVEIGNYVTIAHGVIVHGAIIKDYSMIGIGSIVMDNVVVEPHVIVGVRSVIPSYATLDQGYYYEGNPARKIRLLESFEYEYIHYCANYYANKIEDKLLQAGYT